MTTPKTTTTPTLTEIQIRELLGYSLRAFCDSNALSGWQEDVEIRQRARENADRLITTLAAHGLRVRVSSVRDGLKSLEDLQTVPAHPAYDLDLDTQK